MSMYELDVAAELHRDRERMLAEAFRAGGSAPAFGSFPTLPQGLVSAVASLVRFAGHGARLAH